MKFFNIMPAGQKLLLYRIERKQPATRPLVAKSAPAAAPTAAPVDPLWLTIILTLCAALRPMINSVSCIADQWPPPIWTENRSKLAFLIFLAGVLGAVILENVAANYLERIVGI